MMTADVRMIRRCGEVTRWTRLWRYVLRLALETSRHYSERPRQRWTGPMTNTWHLPCGQLAAVNCLLYASFSSAGSYQVLPIIP